MKMRGPDGDGTPQPLLAQMFTPGLLIKNDLTLHRVQRFVVQANAAAVPTFMDYRDQMLESSNQGSTSQCAAYAVAGFVEWLNWRYNGVRAQVDPNPIYAEAKAIDGFPDVAGTTLEAAVTAATHLQLLSIDIGSMRCVRDAADVKRALHRYGPVIAGFSITSGWQSPTADGWITPGGNVLGGHGVVITGYSDLTSEPSYVGVQNSWGDNSYGWNGFCRMSPAQFEAEFSYALVFDSSVA